MYQTTRELVKAYIIAKKATIVEMTSRSDVDTAVLIQKLEQLIAEHE